ncbi:MAG: pyridoxal-5-phosphate-dependent protein subunit beta [Elusimicrobia bacterium RIFCSPLOWO2_12_FULL_59_9]|nr:MAG: pyridoxal-5-phosphate-dependent protein subunit beta [Elusimicrobia bacterium RIFCSPLOWO2_12_FULL_59_9]
MSQITAGRSVLEKTVEHCRKLKITLPTFSQLIDPLKVPAKISQQLKKVKMSDVHPANLFRITWKNDVRTGLFGGVNFFEIPREITGVRPRIIGLTGKHFPTGAHKVGAAFGCLVPKLVRGEFDPTSQKAVWPSTGNYCRGGAFDSALLKCAAVAILPEEMSRERFEWLKSIGAEVIATPGCESNVKEIYDKCWEIRKTRKDCVIFNQFEEFGNGVWHYHVTGRAVAEAFEAVRGKRGRLAAYVSATGSAGTIAAGDYLRTLFPEIKVAAVEALQCPTLLLNGFGGHRIEGIGDKHVPWIHNVRNTDAVVAVDDEDCLRSLRLFNEPAGKKFLAETGASAEAVESLKLLGISGICNLVASIKLAKYFEMGPNDVLFTVFTDSQELYRSRLQELKQARGTYEMRQAAADFERALMGAHTGNMKELGYWDRKALHNLKYFTWVEQQGKTSEELNRLWDPEFWQKTFGRVEQWDSEIESFNEKTAELKND